LVRVVRGASAVVYAPGTWEVRGDDPWAVRALLGQLRANSLRVVMRPDHPAVLPAVARAARTVAHEQVAVSLLDLMVASPEALRLPQPEVPVRRMLRRERRVVLDRYAARIHKAELAALRLEDLELEVLDAAYRARGLRRDRVVLAAFSRWRILGMCVVNRASPVLGLASVEYVRLDPRAVGERRRAIWNALLAAARDELGDAPIAALTDRDDRPLAAAAGLARAGRRIVVTFEAADDTLERALQPAART
jgi:hypothetical protein